MPTVKITASQVIYYEKVLTLDQEDYDTLMGIYENLSTSDVMQWLVDGNEGLTSRDVVETESAENLDISPA